jgi:hypothetical protein
MKECPVCQQTLKEWYRKERTIKSLHGPIYLVSHIYSCENEACANYRQGILPEEETLLVIKGYKFGLDVIVKVGQLRFNAYKTWEEIRAVLEKEYQIDVSQREIGYLEQAYLALTNIVAKEDRELLEDLEKLTGLILALDGIKPDGSNEVLYLIREIQTGRILAAKIISENVSDNLEKLLQGVIDLGYPILGVVSDKEEAILSTVAARLPNVPHQLCHYHYLKNLALPMIEADSKLKKNCLSG